MERVLSSLGLAVLLRVRLLSFACNQVVELSSLFSLITFLLVNTAPYGTDIPYIPNKYHKVAAPQRYLPS